MISFLALSGGVSVATASGGWDFDFEPSADDAGGLYDDLFDALDELTTAVAAPPSRKSMKPLVRGARNAPRGIIHRGSAVGEVPQLIAAGASIAGVPIMDMRTGRVIEVPTIGNLSLKSTIYDEAEDSRILLGEAVDGSRAGTRFAIKVVFPQSDEDLVELDREIQALTDLREVDSVMRLVYAPEGMAKTPRGKELKYCVLELLGESLQDLLADEFERGNMPMPMIESVAVQGLRTLQAVHALGYVHGDVGMGNLMFTDASRTMLKLIDFGYAKKFRNSDGSHVVPGVNPLPAKARSVLSVSELDGHFPARKDDLHRFGEVLLKLLNTDYTWLFRGATGAAIRKIKMETVPSACCSRADRRFDKYFELVRGLGYDQEPDYAALIDIFA